MVGTVSQTALKPSTSPLLSTSRSTSFLGHWDKVRSGRKHGPSKHSVVIGQDGAAAKADSLLTRLNCDLKVTGQ